MEKFNRLSIIREYKKMLYGKNRTFCECECDCGNIKDVLKSDLVSGNTKSCGCLNRDKLIKRNTKHGLRHHKLYPTYNSMMKRCYNEKQSKFEHYGGRGITVCDEWHNVETFIQWAESNGYEKGLQLDRINNNGNYEPCNCRFVTPQENLRNTRWNVVIEGTCLREYLDKLSEKHNVGFPTLRYRYYKLKDSEIEINEYNLIDNPRWIKKV